VKPFGDAQGKLISQLQTGDSVELSAPGCGLVTGDRITEIKGKGKIFVWLGKYKAVLT